MDQPMEPASNLLPADCGIGLSDTAYCIYARSEEILAMLLSQPWIDRVSQEATNLQKSVTLIYPPDLSEPYQIPVEMGMAPNSQPSEPQKPSERRRTLP